MSATGRNKPDRPRHSDDFYRTPEWSVSALMNAIKLRDEVAFDPGCGDGAIGEALATRSIQCFGVESDHNRAAAAEIAGHYKAVTCTNYLTDPAALTAQTLIICNPPYKHAAEFIRKGLEQLTVDGRGFYLLRLNFLAGQARYRSDLWKNLSKIYVLPKRPSFKWGTTDGCDYAWFSFHNSPDPYRPLPTITWLNPDS